MTPKLSQKKTFVLTGSDDAEGRLFFADGRLCLVVVKLGGSHGELTGHWHIEAGFGPCERKSRRAFPDLKSVQDWIAERFAAG